MLMKRQAKSPKRTVTRGFASRTAESAVRARTLPPCTRTLRQANMCAALLDGSSRTARAWIRGSLPSQVSPNSRTVLVPTAGSDVSVISPRNLRSTRRRRWLGKSARPHPCALLPLWHHRSRYLCDRVHWPSQVRSDPGRGYLQPAGLYHASARPRQLVEVPARWLSLQVACAGE